MRKQNYFLVAGVLGALTVWFFAPALSGAYSFAFRDAAHYYYPLFEWLRHEWGAGRLPLWNPHENLGVALLAENTPSIFYPGKLLFALPLDYTLAYNLYIVSHVALAGATSYGLARRWNASPWGATLGAMSYAFCGNVLFQYCNVVFLVGAAWLPCAISLSDRMLRQRKWRYAVGLGVVLALLITGGDPQMAYNAVLLAALYAVVLWRSDRRDRQRELPLGEPAAPGTASASEQAENAPPTRPRWLASRPVLLGGAVVTCALLAAVQIWPTLEASAQSGRGNYDAPRNVFELAGDLVDSSDRDPRFSWHSGLTGGVYRGHHRQVYHFSVAPWRVIEFLWPNVTGRPFPTDRRWLGLYRAEDNLWCPSLYMGLLPFLLAISAWSLRRQARGDVRLASWMALVGVLGSFGVYGVAWAVGLVFGGSELLDIGGEVGGLYWWLTVLLPNYVYFRYPAKLFVVAALGLSMLAAHGWDTLWQSGSARMRRWLVAMFVASLVGVCAAAALWHQVEREAAIQRHERPLGAFDTAGAWRDVSGGFIQTSALSLAFWSLLKLAAVRPRRAGLASVGAIALTALDLALAQAGLVLYAPADCWRSEPQIIAALPPGLADYRVYRQSDAIAPYWVRANSDDRYTEFIRWDRATLAPKYELPYGISLVEASGTMISADYKTLLDVASERSSQLTKSPLPDDSILDLLSARVAIIEQKASAPGTRPLAQPAQGMVAVLRPGAGPRAWIVHDVERLEEMASAAPWRLKGRTQAVFFPGGEARDLRRVAVIETDQPLDPPIEPAVAGAREHCTLVSAEPMRVELDVELASAGLVVLGDLHFPGWELTVETLGESRKVPIVRTDRVLRGAALPAGKHRLVYRYHPVSAMLGGLTSGVTALGLAVAALVAAARRRARKAARTGS